MRLLKQSTALTLRIGPFLDSIDGATAETGLTIAQADIQISKAGGAFAQTSDASPTTTHDADGWYQLPLTTADTATLGPLTVQVAVAGALPVWEHFMVVPANVYDSLIGGSDNLQVDAVQIEGGDATDAINAAADTAIADAALATASALSTAQTDLDTLTGTDGATLATLQPNYAPATATALATVAAYVDTEVAAIKAKTDNLPAAPAATGDIPTAAQVRAEMDSNSTQLAAIVADTDELQTDWANGGRLDLLVDAILADTAALNDTALPDSVPADGSIPTLKQAVYMVTQFLLERAVSGTTVTVKKVDGSTSLMTLTLNDGSAPTSITRSG